MAAPLVVRRKDCSCCGRSRCKRCNPKRSFNVGIHRVQKRAKPAMALRVQSGVGPRLFTAQDLGTDLRARAQKWSDESLHAMI